RRLAGDRRPAGPGELRRLGARGVAARRRPGLRPAAGRGPARVAAGLDVLLLAAAGAAGPAGARLVGAPASRGPRAARRVALEPPPAAGVAAGLPLPAVLHRPRPAVRSVHSDGRQRLLLWLAAALGGPGLRRPAVPAAAPAAPRTGPGPAG